MDCLGLVFVLVLWLLEVIYCVVPTEILVRFMCVTTFEVVSVGFSRLKRNLIFRLHCKVRACRWP